MPTVAQGRPRRNRAGASSFTLIELLVVMTIIAILAGLILAAGTGVIYSAGRKRAAAEIVAMGTALEGYKTDNGIYPPSDGVLMTNAYATYDGRTQNYWTNSTLVYIALTGQTNYTATPAAGIKTYMTFKPNQVGDLTGAVTGASYVKDPWGYSYGYSTATNTSGATPYNGNGFFDLWSTGKALTSNPNTNAWISNWSQ
jgi:prepilin-type N-terminal cleavage/methylation domain-containing protein